MITFYDLPLEIKLNIYKIKHSILLKDLHKDLFNYLINKPFHVSYKQRRKFEKYITYTPLYYYYFDVDSEEDPEYLVDIARNYADTICKNCNLYGFPCFNCIDLYNFYKIGSPFRSKRVSETFPSLNYYYAYGVYTISNLITDIYIHKNIFNNPEDINFQNEKYFIKLIDEIVSEEIQDYVNKITQKNLLKFS